MKEIGLKGKAITGMAWTGVEHLSTQVIQFVIGIIIARILLPSDYGIIGMLSLFIAIAQTFLDSGFAKALIQKKDRSDKDFSTVFIFNVIASLALYLIFYISAPWIASFYEMPVLTEVTRATTLSLIISGFTIVQQAKLSIGLQFKEQAIASIISVVLSGACGIYMAYNGFGVWALVCQSLLSAMVRSSILWFCSGWIPRLCFSIDSFHSLFSFGSKLLCSSMINTIYNNIYTLVIGKVFNATELGLFNRANQFATLPSSTATQMVVNVNFPILVQMQDDNDKLVQTYRTLLRTPMFILVPILLGIASIGYPMVEVVLGEKWLSCVPYLQILCIGSIFSPLTHINLNLLYVKGRSHLVLRLELIKKPIAFLILLISIPFGIWWMCFGAAIYNFIAFAINCYYTRKILHYGLFSQLKELLNIFANGAIMFVTVTFAMNPFDVVWQKLLIGIFAGIVSYTTYAVFSKDNSLAEIKTFILHRYK